MLKFFFISSIIFLCTSCYSPYISHQSPDFSYGIHDNGNDHFEECESSCYSDYDMCIGNCEGADMIINDYSSGGRKNLDKDDGAKVDKNYSDCTEKCVIYYRECMSSCSRNRGSL